MQDLIVILPLLFYACLRPCTGPINAEELQDVGMFFAMPELAEQVTSPTETVKAIQQGGHTCGQRTCDTQRQCLLHRLATPGPCDSSLSPQPAMHPAEMSGRRCWHVQTAVKVHQPLENAAAAAAAAVLLVTTMQHAQIC